VKRPTIADVARRAGVTKAAVSFALNHQPGVSAATRQRILAIARDMGFQPSSAARALSDGRASAFGLVIDRPARTLGVEPFFMQLIAGIQAELSSHRISLLFTVAEDQDAEMELHRTWWGERRVDGVFLVDLQVGDRRAALLRELRMPAVVFGSPRGSAGLPAIWQDEVAGMRLAVGCLADLGHRRLARVGGIRSYWHTKLRTDALHEVAQASGLEAVSVECDYTSEHGAEETKKLLLGARPPTAILYDNDLMALSGLSVASQIGVAVPADLSIMAWDDSALCQLVHPSLTALRRDTAEIGAEGARRLLRLASGEQVADLAEPTPELMLRASTGQAASVQARSRRVPA
jgi:DNA-binding LacI/PurR family transcriptional regulator